MPIDKQKKSEILAIIQLMAGLSDQGRRLYMRLCSCTGEAEAATTWRLADVWHITNYEKVNIASIMTLLEELRASPEAWQVFQAMGKCTSQPEAMQLLARS
jgi:hypothetical protein